MQWIEGEAESVQMNELMSDQLRIFLTMLAIQGDTSKAAIAYQGCVAM